VVAPAVIVAVKVNDHAHVLAHERQHRHEPY
jgi:hypothetical protein